MTKANDLAFPHADIDHPNQPGLTKREWFAGIAMQGLLTYYTPEPPASYVAQCAKDALIFADALIAELAREEVDG